MSIVLGGVVLNPNLIWEDRAAWSPVNQVVKTTVGGTAFISGASLFAQRPITLVATQDQGWLDKTQYDFLQTIAQLQGAVYSLTIGSDTFSVVLRHHEPPAIELTPLIDRAVALEGDYFIGTLKFMTI